MSTKITTLPSLGFPYGSPSQSDSQGLRQVFVPGSGLVDFLPCRDANASSDHLYVFQPGYCGNYTNVNWANFANWYNLSWKDDSTYTSASNLRFDIKLSSTEDFYYVDWDSPYIAGNSVYFTMWNGSKLNGHYLETGSHFDYSEGSSSGGSEVVPSDDPYVNVEKAIYTAAAVPFVLCFFFVIYRIFMRLRG